MTTTPTTPSENQPLATRARAGRSVYARFGKRTFDLALAVPAAIGLSPLVALVYVLVRWRLGAPTIFRQPRIGRGGIPFTVFKFRSMRDTLDNHGTLLPDAQRLTRFGRILRSASLDELPQLWNIVRGDMSLVGPRPLLTRYLTRYNRVQARRHEVPPGVTGWAQVNGRNSIDWQQKFELDVWYVDHFNLALDVKILWLTVTSVVFRRGISSDQHVTMPEFMGNDRPQ